MTAVATLGVRIPTIRRLRRAGRDALRAAQVTDSAALDADVLLGHVIGFTRAQLLAYGEAQVDAPRARAFAALVARRTKAEPLAYLLGRREFYGMPFRVTPGTLVPRPESETLLDVARARLAGRPPQRVLDLGTGSGCLAAGAAHLFPGCQVWAIDASAAACAVAAANVQRLGYADRVTVLPHTFADPLPPEVDRPVDLVLCNPPYLTDAEWASAPLEVRQYEPPEALRGGPDGLAFYPVVLDLAAHVLRGDGWLVLEVGARQGRAVRALLRQAPWRDAVVRPDLAGRDRVVCARRAP